METYSTANRLVVHLACHFHALSKCALQAASLNQASAMLLFIQSIKQQLRGDLYLELGTLSDVQLNPGGIAPPITSTTSGTPVLQKFHIAASRVGSLYKPLEFTIHHSVKVEVYNMQGNELLLHYIPSPCRNIFAHFCNNGSTSIILYIVQRILGKYLHFVEHFQQMKTKNWQHYWHNVNHVTSVITSATIAWCL